MQGVAAALRTGLAKNKELIRRLQAIHGTAITVHHEQMALVPEPVEGLEFYDVNSATEVLSFGRPAESRQVKAEGEYLAHTLTLMPKL